MAIEFLVERTVPAPPDELYAWFSDYTDRDYSGSNGSPKEEMRRTVLDQDDRHAVFSDHYGRSELRYRAVKKAPSEVEADGVGSNLDGHVSVRITSAPGGARLSVRFRFEAKGIAKLFARAMKGQIERAHAAHVDQFLKDFAAARS